MTSHIAKFGMVAAVCGGLVAASASLAVDRQSYTVNSTSASRHDLKQSYTVTDAAGGTETDRSYMISAHVKLEVDKLSAQDWIPTSQTPPGGGGAKSLDDIFEPLDVLVIINNDDGTITDLAGANGCYSLAELDSLVSANRDTVAPSAGNWNLYAVRHRDEITYPSCGSTV